MAPLRKGREAADGTPEARRHWAQLDLGQQLFDTLGCPVVVENDANALAVRETYANRLLHRDFCLVLVGDGGIGSAVAIDGRVHRGGRGLAGEVGHSAP